MRGGGRGRRYPNCLWPERRNPRPFRRSGRRLRFPGTLNRAAWITSTSHFPINSRIVMHLYVGGIFWLAIRRDYTHRPRSDSAPRTPELEHSRHVRDKATYVDRDVAAIQNGSQEHDAAHARHAVRRRAFDHQPDPQGRATAFARDRHGALRCPRRRMSHLPPPRNGPNPPGRYPASAAAWSSKS
jgi:hypothetical protein